MAVAMKTASFSIFATLLCSDVLSDVTFDGVEYIASSKSQSLKNEGYVNIAEFIDVSNTHCQTICSERADCKPVYEKGTCMLYSLAGSIDRGHCHGKMEGNNSDCQEPKRACSYDKHIISHPSRANAINEGQLTNIALRKCRQECSDTPSCQTFAWSSKSRSCSLYREPGADSTNRFSGTCGADCRFDRRFHQRSGQPIYVHKTSSKSENERNSECKEACSQDPGCLAFECMNSGTGGYAVCILKSEPVRPYAAQSGTCYSSRSARMCTADRIYGIDVFAVRRLTLLYTRSFVNISHCMQMCQTKWPSYEQICKGYEWYQKNGSLGDCYVSRGKDYLDEKEPGFGYFISGVCEHGCRLDDRRFVQRSLKNVSVSNAKSSEGCLNKCKETDGCSYFFGSADGNCTLAKRQEVSELDVEYSGRCQNSSICTYQEHPVWYDETSPFAVFSNIADWDGCENECLSYVQCRAFNYRPATKECRLVNSRIRSDGMGPPDGVSGSC